MALLWCDGFDHYGLTETNMLDGVYAEVSFNTGGNVLSTTQAATGTHSMLIADDSGDCGLRKVLPSSETKLGCTGRFYFPTLGDNNDRACIFSFLTSNPDRGHITAIVDANGCLRFYRGINYGTSTFYNAGTLVAQSDPVIVASAWNHIEVQVYIHATLGWVRAAVNGVHVFEATGLNTLLDSSECVSVAQCDGAGTGTNHFYMDDYIIYNFEGDPEVDTDFCCEVDGDGVATNYIGELQCIYLPPDGDTAEDDWIPSTGTDSFAMVDEVDPVDSDYITSVAAGDLTEFELTDLPEEITYIRGLQLLGRMSKSDSGAAFTTFGMRSDAAVDDAPERPITVEPTYWWDFMNVDPDSSARWTRASLNAAWFRLTRTV